MASSRVLTVAAVGLAGLVVCGLSVAEGQGKLGRKRPMAAKLEELEKRVAELELGFAKLGRGLAVDGVLSARAIEIVDTAGRPRAGLGLQSEGPVPDRVALMFWDEAGQLRGFWSLKPGGTCRLAMADADGEPSVIIDAPATGMGSLLLGGAGECGASVSTGKDGVVGLHLDCGEAGGFVVAEAGPQGQATLRLRDGEGRKRVIEP